MARTFLINNRKGGNAKGGDRIPLSLFREPITIMRVDSAPSQTDASWIRNAKKVGDFRAAVDQGEIKLVAGAKQSDKELFLFVIHRDEAYEFSLADYVVWGKEVYHVQGFRPLGSKRGYYQINTRPWGVLKEGEFVLGYGGVLEAAPLVAPQDASRDNLFWGD